LSLESLSPVLEPPLAGVAEVDGVAAGLTSPVPQSPAEPELEQPAMERQAQTPTASSQNRFPDADRSIVVTVSPRVSSSWDRILPRPDDHVRA
jgi:hypothetical protein